MICGNSKNMTARLFKLSNRKAAHHASDAVDTSRGTSPHNLAKV